MYIKFFKRFFDLTISILALIVLSPLFLVVAVAIKATSKGPAIFKQVRLGKNGKTFKMYKFRSMCLNAENIGTGQYSFKNDPRVTKVGRFIRATSIDELPQLVNIIKGDMSLIGFRPTLTYHPWPFDKYTDEQKKMFRLRPGLTGWAQIHGRKDVLWEDRIAMNVWYSENVSFWLDVKIFFITIKKVLKNEDNNDTDISSKITINDEQPHSDDSINVFAETDKNHLSRQQ